MDEPRARTLLGLGSHEPVSPSEVERAFRRQAHLSHPDSGGDPEAFRNLVSARQTLRDAPLPVIGAEVARHRAEPLTVVPNRTWWQEIMAALRARRASRSRPPRVR